MTTGKHARSIAAALVIGATILGFAAEPAAAAKKKDDGIRCAKHDGDGNLDFYLPGETVEIVDQYGVRHVLRCQADGTWKHVLAPPPTGGITTLPPIVQAP